MKPLLILGLLTSIGGAVLAVMVRSSLKELRAEKDTLNRATVELHKTITEQANAINATNNTFSETAKNAKDTELSTKSLSTDIKGKEEELASIQKDIDDLAAKKQSMQEEIVRILGTAGTPEEILAKNDTLKKENDAKVEEIDTISKEAEIAKKAATESETLIAKLKTQQATRAKSIALVNRTGSISAVNAEFGFVQFNLGLNQGVSSESRLLVKRGNQLIGKLTIVRILGNTTIADIDTSSLTAGFQILPGDEVIFENSPT